MENIVEVAAVCFKKNGPKYYFLTDNIELKNNISVIVETERGLQFGFVEDLIKMSTDNNNLPNKKIIRISTKKDYSKYLNNIKDSKEAFKKCKELIKKNNLDMNLLDASYNFDRSQLFFNYIANERVDFRELAKQLASLYKVRIELRQVGPRDKAKEVGGLGPCGRALCCSNYLYSFNNITINMAKNQNISLNPTKINGLCNRLLCCLSYEDETYKEEMKKLPRMGEKIKYNDKEGKIISIDIFSSKVKIETKDKEIIEIDNYGSNK